MSKTNNRVSMSRRDFLLSLSATAAMLSSVPALSACSFGNQGTTGTWYGVDEGGNLSTLEINADGTWLFNGRYVVNGEWSETDGGTVVLSAPLMSVPIKMEGSGDDRILSFAGDDPSSGNATAISMSTFYATEAARDGAVA